jgi:hypothetical protein
MGIEGIPIPYGAPNASPHIERLNRTLREEAPNHLVFLNVKHVRRVCAEYRDFYNSCAFSNWVWQTARICRGWRGSRDGGDAGRPSAGRRVDD